MKTLTTLLVVWLFSNIKLKENSVEKAKKEILSLLLKSEIGSGLEKAVKHISSSMEVPYEELKKWAVEEQQKVQKIIQTAQKAYKKVEIEFDDNKSDALHMDTALDENVNVYRRLDSIHLIKDRDVLINTYKKSNCSAIKKEIITICKLQEIYDLALHEKDESLRLEAIKAIHNDMKLKDEAEKNSSYLIRIEAIKKLKNKDLNTLQKIILTDKEPKVIKAALNQITSVAFLEAFQENATVETKELIQNRISILKGEEDYLKKSVEDLIKTYN
jgi:hypothetical protein